MFFASLSLLAKTAAEREREREREKFLSRKYKKAFSVSVKICVCKHTKKEIGGEKKKINNKLVTHDAKEEEV
jgi:predicted peroxiredoxin